MRCALAKVRRITILTQLTSDFKLAHELATGSMRTNLHSVHPTKLNALKQICSIHSALNHTGMVFVQHLFAAKILKRILGEKWEILSGSSAHGEEDTNHSTAQNASIVARFNANELSGIIATAVGESSLDAFSSSFCYLIVFDAHGGEAAAAQRAGRLFRTPRIAPKPNQSKSSLLSDRLAEQKPGFYYDLVSPGTEEESAARAREAKFVSEGYKPAESIAMTRIMSMAVASGTNLPFKNLRDSLHLLKETLSYQELGRNATLGKAVAAEVRAPHFKEVAAARERARNSSSIFKERKTKSAQKLAKQRPVVNEEARLATRELLNATVLPRESLQIFKALKLSSALLQELGIDFGASEADEASN